MNEIVGTHGGALLPERAPGAKARNKTPRMYRPLTILMLLNLFYFHRHPQNNSHKVGFTIAIIKVGTYEGTSPCN